MVIRAKTTSLFSGKPLTDLQQANTDRNIIEMESGAKVLNSVPRRIVLELTNACNLSCVMCGRNASDFCLTRLDMEWFYALEPLFDTIEEVTLMGWGEPSVHPNFEEMLRVIDRHSARKYFCTNGKRLNKLQNTIFDTHVDVFAVSVDGAKPETNDRIRKGSDLVKINENLRAIVLTKRSLGLKYPHINYVFCAMRSNLHELPDLVDMAAEVGLEEVKVVFLTAFNESLASEVLYNCQNEVEDVFGEAIRRGEEKGVLLKLPFIQGTDPAGDKYHRDCFVSYRDFFLGSDGFVRPCMSTAEKFFKFDPTRDFMDMWNAVEFQNYRQMVNTPKMSENCKSCYQSSHCNWNNKKSHLQLGEEFVPQWEKIK